MTNRETSTLLIILNVPPNSWPFKLNNSPFPEDKSPIQSDINQDKIGSYQHKLTRAQEIFKRIKITETLSSSLKKRKMIKEFIKPQEETKDPMYIVHL